MTNIKLSPRLKCIADLIGENSYVIDIGCDHGLLDIYLTTVKDCICQASDISLNVLEKTKENLEKYGLINKISIVQSDGLENIEVKKSNIVVISGMGTSTILKILDNSNAQNIEHLIIQSNNEIDILRKNICKKFYIFDEKIVNDNDKDYIVIYFKRGIYKYSNLDYLFGPIIRKNVENSFYFKKIYQKNVEILKKIPNKYIIKKIKLMIYLWKIKKFTSINYK